MWGGGRGCLSLETLSGKEEFYRLLFTKKKKPEARKTFNSSQLQGTAAVVYPPQAPAPLPSCSHPGLLAFVKSSRSWV